MCPYSIFSCQNLYFCDLLLFYWTPKFGQNEKIVIFVKWLNFSRDKRLLLIDLKNTNWTPLRVVVPHLKSLTWNPLGAHKAINGNLQVTLNISKVKIVIMYLPIMRLHGLTKMSSFSALAGVISFLRHSQSDLSNFMIPPHGYVTVIISTVMLYIITKDISLHILNNFWILDYSYLHKFSHIPQ